MRAVAMMVSVAWLLLAAGLRADEVKEQSEVAQPPSAVFGNSAQPGAAVLQAVAKMTMSQQQAWLGRLEQRAGRAARLTMGPDEAARQQARIAALLHQKLVTWQVLRELIEETDRRERAAIRSAGPEHVGAIPEKPRFENGRPPAKIARRQVESVKVQRSEKREESAKPPAAPQEEEGAKARTGEKLTTGEKVEVNVEELTARIAGSNLGIRTLESDLDEKGTWDAARLEPLAERLRILVLRHADLSLFRSLVPADQRSSVGRLESPKSAISELGAHISEARKLVSGEEFKGTEAQRRAELDRLETLSRRLAELAGK